MLRNVPHLALIPLVILWFGIDESAKIFLVALGTLFPIYINTARHPQYRSRSGGDGAQLRLIGFSLFAHVILPGALPSIMVGVRFALGLMWLTLIVAETISANSGIGYGDERPRIPANGRGGGRHHSVCTARQTRRRQRTVAGAQLAALEPVLYPSGGESMNTARLNQGTPLLLNGVTKRYGENTILNGLDLHIPAGQFVAVVGRSGGGKAHSCVF